MSRGTGEGVAVLASSQLVAGCSPWPLESLQQAGQSCGEPPQAAAAKLTAGESVGFLQARLAARKHIKDPDLTHS